MSVKIMSQVWDHGPTDASERLLLLAIADHADDYGIAWPGEARLAEKCCVTERTVRRTLRRLEEAGWLVTRTGGGRYPNRYQIQFPDTPVTDDTGVTGDTPDADVPPDAHDPPPRTPTSSEPSENHHLEPSGGEVPDYSRVRPSRFPGLAWQPNPQALGMASALAGRLVDPAVSLGAFKAHHLTSGRVSKDWSGEFVKWVARDVERARERRIQNDTGSDEFGITPWQRGH